MEELEDRVCRALLALRTFARVTQADVADGMGVDVKTMVKQEQGKVPVSIGFAWEYAALCGGSKAIDEFVVVLHWVKDLLSVGELATGKVYQPPVFVKRARAQ